MKVTRVPISLPAFGLGLLELVTETRADADVVNVDPPYRAHSAQIIGSYTKSGDGVAKSVGEAEIVTSADGDAISETIVD